MIVLKKFSVDLNSCSPWAKEQFCPMLHFPLANSWQSFVFLRFGGSLSSASECA